MIKRKDVTTRKRRKMLKEEWKPSKPSTAVKDEEILSSEDEGDEAEKFDLKAATEVKESATEIRNRLAREVLAKVERARKAKQEQDEGEAIEMAHARFEETDQLLRKEVLRHEGRLHRLVADNLREQVQSEPVTRSHYRGPHRLSVTSVCVSADESMCFSGAKDGSLVGCDVETNTIVWKPAKIEESRILGVACSSDGTFVASCGDKKGSAIRIWDVRDPSPHEPLKVLEGHRDVVTQLVFRHNTSVLLSASDDRSVRIYNAGEGSFIEHLYGHTSKITSIDCLQRERCVTAAEDSTVRLWKIPEETHLVLSGKHNGPIDCVKMLNESVFVSGAQEGTLALWTTSKRRPMSCITDAHGPTRWIESLAALPYTNLIASGSDDGLIRLWRVDLDKLKLDENPVAAIPCEGHVNSLAFAPRSGRFLVAGVGQEPRLGRWRVTKQAKNGVHIFTLPNVYEEAEDIVK